MQSLLQKKGWFGEMLQKSMYLKCYVAPTPERQESKQKEVEQANEGEEENSQLQR